MNIGIFRKCTIWQLLLQFGPIAIFEIGSMEMWLTFCYDKCKYWPHCSPYIGGQFECINFNGEIIMMMKEIGVAYFWWIDSKMWQLGSQELVVRRCHNKSWNVNKCKYKLFMMNWMAMAEMGMIDAFGTWIACDLDERSIDSVSIQ